MQSTLWIAINYISVSSPFANLRMALKLLRSDGSSQEQSPIMIQASKQTPLSAFSSLSCMGGRKLGKLSSGESRLGNFSADETKLLNRNLNLYWMSKNFKQIFVQILDFDEFQIMVELMDPIESDQKSCLVNLEKN